LAKPGMSMYDRVGNNCLVFFTNDRAKQVCEDNPDTIQGVIINDYHCTLDPSSILIGSKISGSTESPAIVEFGSSILFSNIVAARVRKSRIERSHVLTGEVDTSTITDSIVSGKLVGM